MLQILAIINYEEEIWFHPPSSSNVSTKIGNKFLILLDHHFSKSTGQIKNSTLKILKSVIALCINWYSNKLVFMRKILETITS